MSEVPATPDPGREERTRRISYFMLVRVVMLAGFTVLATVLAWTRGEELETRHAAWIWGTIAAGFMLTLAFARALPRVANLQRFAGLQVATDLGLSAVAVFLSGGSESGFVTLYLLAVLGAAVMGTRRQTWSAAAVACALYSAGAAVEWSRLVVPMTLEPFVVLPRPELTANELAFNLLRTLGGIVGVAVLSSYLNVQISASAIRIDDLRLLNEHIVRSISSGLLTVDMKATVLYFNPAAHRILDLDDDVIGRSLHDVIPGCPNEATRAEDRLELVLRTRHSRTVRVGLSVAELNDAAGIRLGHVVNFQDLTRLHELSQQVRRNERFAAVGSLAASVAHEIRNPLAAISGSAELLSSEALNEEDSRLLAVIQRESTRLSTLLRDLMSFTRPHRPNIKRFVVQDAIRQACEAFLTDPAWRVDLELAIDGRADAIDADPAQLTQVLWNLLRNAAQAMDGVGRIVVSVEASGCGVSTAILDEGPGVHPEHIERVFEPFFTTKESGTGFGLAIVQRIVEDNGGSIACIPQQVGARFELWFPLANSKVSEDSGVLDVDELRGSAAELR